MIMYVINLNPPKTITIVSKDTSPFSSLSGYQKNDEGCQIDFNRDNALLLREFLPGKKFIIGEKERTILRFLADEDDFKNASWALTLSELHGKALSKKFVGIKTDWDLLHFLPLRYIDKSNPQSIAELEIGQWSVVIGTIVNQPKYDYSRNIIKIVVQDTKKQRISAVFFRQKWLAQKFKEGDEVVIYGNYSEYVNATGGKFPQLTNAQIDSLKHVRGGMPMIPIYPQRSGDKSWQIQKQIENLLGKIVFFEDPVPKHILDKYNLMSRNDAYRKVHFPSNRHDVEKARERIAFDEFVRLQVFFHNRKTASESDKSSVKKASSYVDLFVKALPYKITDGQETAIKEILSDLEKPYPMQRLLQGDVGSGKAQPLYSTVLTTTGFKNMGDIVIGDELVNPEGGKSKVVGVFPQGPRPVYKITFDDNTQVEADFEHLWEVFLKSKSQLKTTGELFASIAVNPSKKWKIKVPLMSELGNVSLNEQELSNIYGIINDENPSQLDLNSLLSFDNLTRFSLFKKIANDSIKNKEKFIFKTEKEYLANVIIFLGRSLGIKMSLEYKDGLVVKGLFPPVLLSDSYRNTHLYKTISKIEYSSIQDSQCIKVDSSNGLYITDGFNTTHNTTVGIAAILTTFEAGYQSAMLAPTDILAQQLYSTVTSQLEQAGIPIKVGLFTGKLKAKEKTNVLNNILKGELDLVIGTHALLQGTVNFNNLGLLIIDEQHKFGTEQRNMLRISNSDGTIPDTLVMTATPIPRTTAQVIYGDMEISVIDELPSERLPIKTKWVSKIDETIGLLKDELSKGHQAYIITPMIEENLESPLDIENAEQVYKDISELFPERSVGLLHGKMSGQEKDKIMAAYKANQINILVSTTVVEVGVNVPNATVIAILNANRFGMASLHQMRGRVGRGAIQSYCFLVGEATTPEAEERFNALLQSNDGFYLAEKDLEIRGEGKIFGKIQSGMNDLFIANLREHKHVLALAKKVAKAASSSSELQSEINIIYSDKTSSI
jgi:ATP-dependent DNA helicase RecG